MPVRISYFNFPYMRISEHALRALLHAWLVEQNEEGVSEPSKSANYQQLAETCSYSLIENYTPGCPGRGGDVLTVIWDPVECFDLFLLEGTSLTSIAQGRLQ